MQGMFDVSYRETNDKQMILLMKEGLWNKFKWCVKEKV